MVKRVFASCLAVAVLLGAYSLPRAVLGTEEEAHECDMKTVISGYCCESCERILDKKELVSDQTFYECPDCGLIAKFESDCPDCERALEKKTSGKNVCSHCYGTHREAEVCVKTCHECPDCGERKAAAGTCKSCEVEMEQVTVKAIVQYQCADEDCGETANKPGKCGDEECGKHGKPLVRVCTESGEFPHVR